MRYLPSDTARQYGNNFHTKINSHILKTDKLQYHSRANNADLINTNEMKHVLFYIRGLRIGKTFKSSRQHDNIVKIPQFDIQGNQVKQVLLVLQNQ